MAVHAQPHPDPALAATVTALIGLQAPERNAFVEFYQFWRSLPREHRAVLAKVVRPELSEEGVAALVGVSRRQLVRYPCYQRIKPTLADFLLSRPRPDHTRTKRRRGFSNPDIPAG